MNRIQLDSILEVTRYYSEHIFAHKNNPTKLKNTGYSHRLRYYTHCGNNKCEFVEITPQEAFDLRSKNASIFPNSTGKINKGDKVFFNDSLFPSLLLGRLDLDLKRTTKADTADKIISDCKLTTYDCFKKPVLLDVKNKIFVEVDVSYKENKVTYVTRISSIISILKSLFNYDMKFYVNISVGNFEIYENVKTYPNKYVTTTEFEKYVVSQLPALQQSECDNICDMLKCVDCATVSTALGTLQYYNFSDCCVDILGALVQSKCTILPNNREAEYIYDLLHVNRDTISTAKYRNTQERIHLFMDTLNKFVVTPNMSTKDKVYTILRDVLYKDIDDRYHKEFERLNVTFNLTPNDTNGETNVSTPEVEGA